MTTYQSVTYDKHTAVKFGAAFWVDGVTLTDPTTVSVDVLSPDGVITSYTTADPELSAPPVVDLPQEIADDLGISTVQNSTPWTGLAIFEITLDQEGDWRIRWKSSGGATAAKEVLAVVHPTVFA